MKSINFKRTLFLATTVTTIAPFLLSSCGTKSSKDSRTETEEQHEENIKSQDAKFLVNATEINLKEIKISQLAEDKGTAFEVRELGKMMKDQHTQSLQGLENLAAKKGVEIPTSITQEGQDAYNKLNEKKGSDFDKAYCDMMVTGHKEVISKFEKALTECSDEDVRAWITATLPVLQSHLDHSINCQKKCEKM